MSSLPFTASECFFVAIVVFVIIGFQRGWRRELVTLVFVLLAVILIRPGSDGGFIASLFARIPSMLSYLFSGSTQTSSTGATISNNFLGPWGILLAFLIVVVLGYVAGNRIFPKPAAPTERILGIVPSLISGAFILGYLTTGNFFAKNQLGQSFFSVVVQPPDPMNYVPILFVIALVAVIVGFIVSRAKKPAAKK